LQESTEKTSCSPTEISTAVSTIVDGVSFEGTKYLDFEHLIVSEMNILFHNFYGKINAIVKGH